VLGGLFFVDSETSLPQIQALPAEVYVTNANHLHKLNTDADLIEYELKSEGKKISGEVLRLNNPSGKALPVEITLNFPDSGAYELLITAYDEVYNKSSYRQEFTVDLSPSGGSEDGFVYGSGKDYPWGKDINYLNEGRVEFIADGYSGKATLENFALSAPVLTLSRLKGNTVNTYGHGPSKQTPIYVKNFKIFPSYNQAKEICSLSYLPGFIQPFKKDDLDCLKNQLGDLNLSLLFQRVSKSCDQIIYWHRLECMNKYASERPKRHIGTVERKLEHVRISYQTSLEKEFAHSWQEQEAKFQLTSGKIERVVTRATAYGTIEVEGYKTSYQVNSPYSRFLTPIFIPEENSLPINSKCGNTSCRILPVAYFNQAVNDSGKWETWSSWHKLAGGQSCAAASSVMALGFLKKLTGGHRLKSYVYQDNSQNLKHKVCQKPGAFAVTSANTNCNHSSYLNTRNYLEQYGLKTKNHWAATNDVAKKAQLQMVKASIDRGKPVLLSYKSPVSHVLLIVGYTFDNQIVVNDPYRDIQNNLIRGKYDYSGKGAIYTLYPEGKFNLNYLTEIL
jgi:hypothetical protein